MYDYKRVKKKRCLHETNWNKVINPEFSKRYNDELNSYLTYNQMPDFKDFSDYMLSAGEKVLKDEKQVNNGWFVHSEQELIQLIEKGLSY